MKRKNTEDDRKVFSYINSEKCIRFEDLMDFLIDHKLPMMERWAYYFLGMKEKIKEDNLNRRYSWAVNGIIYYWKGHLQEKERLCHSIKEDLVREGDDASDDAVEKEFIRSGWEYVFHLTRLDDEWDAIRLYEENFD